jgi:hypothetical protein
MTAKSQYIPFMDIDLVMKAITLREQNTPMKTFDWDRAAQLIRDKKPKIAEAGLAGDWSYTGGVIYNGAPVYDEYTYLSSMWAIPTLIMDDEEIPCWSIECEWNENTKWPESAIKILEG